MAPCDVCRRQKPTAVMSCRTHKVCRACISKFKADGQARSKCPCPVCAAHAQTASINDVLGGENSCQFNLPASSPESCDSDDDLKGYNDEIEKLLQPDYSASRPKRPGYKRHGGSKKQQSPDTQQQIRGAHPPATPTSISTPVSTSSSRKTDTITSYVPISVLHRSAMPTADPGWSVTPDPSVDSDSSDDKKPAVTKIRKDPKVHDLQAHSESQVARTSHRRLPRYEEASHSCISVPEIVKPAFGMSADRSSHSGGSSQSTGCLKVTTACTNLPFQEKKTESDLDVGPHKLGEFQIKAHIAGRDTIGDNFQKPQSIIHSELKRKLGTNSPPSDAYFDSESLSLKQSPVRGMPASPRNTPESLCEAAEVIPMNRMVTGYEDEKPWTPVLSRAASSSSGSSIERGTSPCKATRGEYARSWIQTEIFDQPPSDQEDSSDAMFEIEGPPITSSDEMDCHFKETVIKRVDSDDFWDF